MYSDSEELNIWVKAIEIIQINLMSTWKRQMKSMSSWKKKALDSFQIEPGMRVDLIAAEPLVIDPAALAFDENRQMYIVKDRGYPDPVEHPRTSK